MTDQPKGQNCDNCRYYQARAVYYRDSVLVYSEKSAKGTLQQIEPKRTTVEVRHGRTAPLNSGAAKTVWP